MKEQTIILHLPEIGDEILFIDQVKLPIQSVSGHDVYGRYTVTDSRGNWYKVGSVEGNDLTWDGSKGCWTSHLESYWKMWVGWNDLTKSERDQYRRRDNERLL